MKQTNNSEPLQSQLPQWKLTNKKVLVRIDGDVPLKNGTKLDDSRLIESLPTLELIKQKKGKIILLTHIGRPTNQDPQLSTRILLPWFEKKGFSVAFVKDFETAAQLSANQTTDIVLLENLRYYKEEQQPDKTFAKTLAKLGDFYVNEAFGTSHRTDTSITLLPQEFSKYTRTIGLRFEKEITALSKLQDNPARPFVVVLGGGKVKDKLPYILDLLPKVDAILLCPAVVFTLLKAQGKEVGASLVADDLLPVAEQILQAKDADKKLIFPIDYQVASESITGQLSIINAQEFKPTMIGIAIGPKSITEFSTILATAQSIFFNGPMGFENRKETLQATCALLTALSHSSAFTVVGGGDSVAAAHECKAASALDHLSTGGGACLAFLCNINLPGIHFLR